MYMSYRKRVSRRSRASSAPRFEALEPRLLLATWSGTLAGDTSFGAMAGEVEEITGDLTVPVGVTLSILPGTVIKLRPNTDLLVRGTVTGPGTAASPITITSVKDDSVGGDTNGDGAATAPAAGDWGGIQLLASTANVDRDARGAEIPHGSP